MIWGQLLGLDLTKIFGDIYISVIKNISEYNVYVCSIVTKYL